MPDFFIYFLFFHETSRFIARELGAAGPSACALTRPASCLRATPLRSLSGGDAKSSIRSDSREESAKEKKEKEKEEKERKPAGVFKINVFRLISSAKTIV